MDDRAPGEAPARNKSGGDAARKAQGATVEAPPEANRMESLLDHWNIPRPDVRPGTPEPAPVDGPPVTALAAEEQGKGGPGPDGLTLLFSLLVAGFAAGAAYVGYRNWSKRYQPA